MVHVAPELGLWMQKAESQIEGGRVAVAGAWEALTAKASETHGPAASEARRIMSRSQSPAVPGRIPQTMPQILVACTLAASAPQPEAPCSIPLPCSSAIGLLPCLVASKPFPQLLF